MERPLLDPQLLQSFVAIVETGSFTRAAERIHLTQSTLSQQMRRLEQQLGCTLLDRSGRQVVTTAQGETLLGLARRILGLLARAGERVSEASHPLRLGVPEDFAAGAMTPVLAAFARAHPSKGESWIWPSSSRGAARGSPSPAGASPWPGLTAGSGPPPGATPCLWWCFQARGSTGAR